MIYNQNTLKLISNSSSLFKESFIPNLTDRQKTILKIALCALSFAVVYCLSIIARRWSLKPAEVAANPRVKDTQTEAKVAKAEAEAAQAKSEAAQANAEAAKAKAEATQANAEAAKAKAYIAKIETDVLHKIEAVKTEIEAIHKDKVAQAETEVTKAKAEARTEAMKAKEAEIAKDRAKAKVVKAKAAQAKAEAEAEAFKKVAANPIKDSKFHQKYGIKIINAKDFPNHKEAIKQVDDILKEFDGDFFSPTKLSKEYEGDKTYQTLLAVKDDKIIGCLTGQIEKNNIYELEYIEATRFKIYRFAVHKDWRFAHFRPPLEQVGTRLMLEAMKKTKELGIKYFSYAHSLDLGPEYKDFCERETTFYKNLNTFVDDCKCNVKVFKKIGYYRNDEGTDETNHVSYDVELFEYEKAINSLDQLIPPFEK